MKTGSFPRTDNLSLKVADFLRNAIIRGEWKPGQRLNELLIASKLGISRSPIREAFRILESENLVDIYSRRGAFVKNLSAKEVEEVYVVINVIERTALRLALKHIDTAREKELRFIIERLEKNLRKNDPQRFLTFSMQLHHFIIKNSENSLLLKIYNYLQPQRERLRRFIGMGKNDVVESLKEHLAISRALLKRDEEETDRLLANHFDRGVTRVLKNLQKAKSSKEPRPQGGALTPKFSKPKI
jgi:DNA-binding GntR family transcriptional regulator